MLQKLQVNIFQWIQDSFQFHQDFMKLDNEKSDKGYFLKNYLNCIVIYNFSGKNIN